MTADSLENTENKENVVRTTVRMDGRLHRRLTDLVYEMGRGLPPRQRPSMDSVIQDAVRAHIEAYERGQVSATELESLEAEAERIAQKGYERVNKKGS